MSAVIEIENLTKIYEGAIKSQDVAALKDLSITVNEREIFAYLGPNGSGKTTTIKLLLGLIFPTAGKMRILGKEDLTSPEVRRNIGYLPEGAYYPDFLKGEEVLRFYGHLYGLTGKTLEKRIDETLNIVGMTKTRRRLIRGYSKGMRQRIGLAQALINDPQILILDEPTTGLDPIARKEIRDILKRLRDEGKTLFISSHELLEVELISDRISILYEGVLQASGALGDLLTNRDVTIRAENVSPQAFEVIQKTGAIADDRVEGKVTWRVPSTVSVYDVLAACKAQGASLTSVAPQRETLEELFVRVVGDAVRQKE